MLINAYRVLNTGDGWSKWFPSLYRPGVPRPIVSSLEMQTKALKGSVCSCVLAMKGSFCSCVLAMKGSVCLCSKRSIKFTVTAKLVILYLDPKDILNERFYTAKWQMSSKRMVEFLYPGGLEGVAGMVRPSWGFFESYCYSVILAKNGPFRPLFSIFSSFEQITVNISLQNCLYNWIQTADTTWQWSLALPYPL